MTIQKKLYKNIKFRVENKHDIREMETKREETQAFEEGYMDTGDFYDSEYSIISKKKQSKTKQSETKTKKKLKTKTLTH